MEKECITFEIDFFLLLCKSADLGVSIYSIVKGVSFQSKKFDLDLKKVSLILFSSLNVCDLQQYFDQAVFTGIFPSVLNGVWLLFGIY